MKLKDYATYWYYTYRMPRQRKSTQACFTSLIHLHICMSDLGNKEIAAIRAKDIQVHLTDSLMHGNRKKLKNINYEGQQLSNYTVIRIRQILIAIFAQAVKEDIVNKNYAADTESLSLPWHNVPVFTPDTQRKFLYACRGHRFHLAYVLFFYCGCRRSEILGLSWAGIDFRKSTITIQQTLLIENKKLVLHEQTKTKTSIRIIPIPKEIKTMLQDWKRKQQLENQQPNYNNEYNLVFTNKNGTPHNPAYFSRNFKNMVKKLPFCDNRLHLHSARHSWATNMIQCGIPISDVQALGGWSRPDTLLNIYSHTVKQSQRRAMKKLFATLK